MTEPNRIKLRHILPSVVTVFAICAGLTSVRMTLEGRLETGLYFILLAVLLDAADGKLARYLDTASPFGAELDTLADFFNFGIAPGVMLYHTLYFGTDHANLGWLATLVLAVCCALRLARFNLSTKAEKNRQQRKRLFCWHSGTSTGLPRADAGIHSPSGLGYIGLDGSVGDLCHWRWSACGQHCADVFDQARVNPAVTTAVHHHPDHFDGRLPVGLPMADADCGECTLSDITAVLLSVRAKTGGAC